MNKWLQIALLSFVFNVFSSVWSTVGAQDTLSAFHLISPADSTFWGVSQQCRGARLFRWQTSVPSVSAVVGYQVVFYSQQQPSTPVWSWPSTPSNLDTFIQIPEDSLIMLIGRLGALNRQSLTLLWDVLAENDNTKLSRNSNQKWALSLITDIDTLRPVNLVLPTDGASVSVTRVAPVNLEFQWNTAIYNIPNSITSTSYQLEIDTNPGFSSPLTIVNTPDTTWLLNRSALDSIAVSAGLALTGQPRLFYWRVKAEQCGVIQSNSVVRQFFISRIDEQTQPFGILSPTFGQQLVIPENANRNYSFTWTNPAAPTQTVPIQVQLLIDSLNGNFSQPWLSLPVPAGDTSLSIQSSFIRQRLSSLGVVLNSPISMKWAVSANYGNNLRLSGNANLIFFERKLDTLSKFSTVLPSDSLTLEVAASGTINQTFVWQPSVQNLGDSVTYRWKFWPINGSPQAPLWSVQSNNFGLQNQVTINQSQWNALLDSAGISVNQSVEGFWTAEALSGGLSRLADSVRYLRVIRVIDSLASFEIINPANNSVVLLAQQTIHPVQIRWSKSVNLRNNPVTYTLRLDTLGNVNNIPLWTGSVVNDTSYSFSNIQLNALLQSVGTTTGNSRIFRLSLSAQSIGQERQANFAVELTLRRVQDSIGPFTPLSPTMATTLPVGNSLAPVVFRWSKPRSFPDSLQYTLMFDIPTGNFSLPIFERPIGTDTFLNFQSGQLDSLLAGLGVFQGQTYSLRWAVRARIGTQTRRSSIFSLNLTRFIDTLSVFNLLSPSDSAFLVLTNNPPTTINLRWNSSRSSNLTPVSYKCYWDIPSGNFSNPFFTKSSGSDTALTITNTEMASALLTLGAIPDTGTYLWTVVAESGPLALRAKSSRLVQIVWNLTTAVDDLQAQIQVFPNPVTDKVNIQANLQGSWAFSLLDLAGKVWKKGVIDFDRGLGVLPISEANSGLYFLQLCKDQTCRTVKIVKQ